MIPSHVMRELRYIEVYTKRHPQPARRSLHQSATGAGIRLRRAPAVTGRETTSANRLECDGRGWMRPYVRHTHAERELNVMMRSTSPLRWVRPPPAVEKELMTFITARCCFRRCRTDQYRIPRVSTGAGVQPPRRTRAAAWSVLERCGAVSSSGPDRAAADGPAPAEDTQRMSWCSRLGFITDKSCSATTRSACSRRGMTSSRWCPQDPSETSLPAGRATCRSAI